MLPVMELPKEWGRPGTNSTVRHLALHRTGDIYASVIIPLSDAMYDVVFVPRFPQIYSPGSYISCA